MDCILSLSILFSTKAAVQVTCDFDLEAERFFFPPVVLEYDGIEPTVRKLSWWNQELAEAIGGGHHGPAV